MVTGGSGGGGFADLAGPALRAHFAGYRRFESGPRACRVVLLTPPYYVGAEIHEALVARGHQVVAVRVPSEASGFGAFVQELLLASAQAKPDFVLSINHFGFDTDGALAGLLATLELPVAVWYVDDPETITGAVGAQAAGNERTGLFVWDRACVERMRTSGVGHAFVEWLPLGVSETRLRAGSPAGGDPRLGERILFVGNSWSELTRKAASELADGQIEACAGAVDALARDGTLAKDALLDRCGATHADPALRVRMLRYVQRAASRIWRRQVLSALDPGSLTIVGDPAWEALVPGAERVAPTDYHRETAGLYARAGVLLNVTSRQMPSAVNQRVFDVPAAGGFVLSDAQGDVAELFGDVAPTYASPEEARERAEWWLANPTARRGCTQRVRSLIAARHTYAHRADALVQRMAATFGQHAHAARV